jgi:sugar phosphate isomerase/epimerase
VNNQFSLSTSWNSSNHTNGKPLIDEIKTAGFDTVELGFALSKEMVDQIADIYRAGELRISSLHNMCPIPAGMERAKATPDYYSMTSLHESERKQACEIAATTIEYAKALGARAVVLHTGFVNIRDRLRELAAAFSDKEKYAEIKSEMIRDREAVKRPYIDSLIKSLQELSPIAVSNGIALAVETRYHHRDIPIMDEYDEIFSYFKPGELFYWHDVGHAEAFERLGLARHDDYLKRFQNRLIGIHLHDIIGLINDHNAPGAGTFDFSRLKPYVTKDTIKVIEAHMPATAEELKHSVELLNNIFVDQEA